MSLCEQVRRDTQGMSADKMAALREQLRQHTNIPVVRPKRPDRKGINSEVVIEKRLAQGKLLKQFFIFYLHTKIAEFQKFIVFIGISEECLEH